MRPLLSALLLLVAAQVDADTEQDPVLQVKQSFLPDKLEVKAGATVLFKNADDVNHNLQTVSSSGEKQDYGTEKPGESTKISFPTAGAYTVICGIHPKMKLRVTVK
jgi:plastocyanin